MFLLSSFWLRSEFLPICNPKIMNPLVKKVGIVLIIIAAFFAIYIYAKFDPETTFFPKCPFFWATGLKCPGCGSQRALHQLLHLRVGSAFQYNACLVVFIPIILFLLIADALRYKYPKLYFASRNPVLSRSIPVVILLWWILRNVFGW